MGVPLWRIEIHKALAAEKWDNAYLTDDATIEDAQDLAQLLLTFEQHIHMDIVNFEYVLISSYTKGDRVFRHLTINEPGLQTTQDYLPLFNTLRFDFGTTNSDPGRKYYRAPMPEGGQVDGVLTPTEVTAFQGIAQTYLVDTDAISHIVTPRHNNVSTVTVYPYVQERQLHRRRRKKVVPTP